MADKTTPTFDTWESYFYAETYDPATRNGTLVNKLDERDAGVLQAAEYGRAEWRERQIRDGKVTLARTYDGDHVRAIHGHLFQDIYDWAGQHRVVPIHKGHPATGLRPFAAVDNIRGYLDDVARLVKETPWRQLDHTAFSMKAAEVFVNLNQAHPFREGNGRAAKLFMHHVSELSHFRIDYNPETTGITRAIWNQQSALSGPDLNSTRPHADQMLPVFARLARPAPAGPTATIEAGTNLSAAMQAKRVADMAFGDRPRRATARPPAGGGHPAAAPRPPQYGNNKGRGYGR